MKKKVKRRLLPRRKMAASDVLERAVSRYTTDRISLGELVHALHERGFAIIMLLLVLPNCVPIPVPPGVSTILSLPLIFFSVQMLIGWDAPWLPRWLKRRTIRRETLSKMVALAAPRLKKIEKVLKPRYPFASSQTGERVIGLLWLIFSLSIAIPLPGTNFLPGLGIMIMALGLLSRDGLIIAAGMLVGMAGIGVTTAILIAGVKAVKASLPFLFPG